MYTTVNEHDFIEAFIRMGRAITDDNPSGNFTIDALRALFEWYENLEDDTGEPFELDVVGICCDWSEYPNFWEAFADQYADPADCDQAEGLTDSEREDQAREYFYENTQIIEFDAGVLIMGF